MKSVELLIHQLMLPGCHCNMEEKVKGKVAGVHSAVINPHSNFMFVEFDPKKTNSYTIQGQPIKSNAQRVS